jgi:hypothetical protein
MAAAGFGTLVKAVVDVKTGVMAVDGELHADQEALLLEDGSSQRELWGVNLYPDVAGDDVVDSEIRARIRDIVTRLVRR